LKVTVKYLEPYNYEVRGVPALRLRRWEEAKLVKFIPENGTEEDLKRALASEEDEKTSDKCYECGADWEESEQLTWTSWSMDVTLGVCPACLNEFYFSCEGCGVADAAELLTAHEGRWLCKECEQYFYPDGKEREF
jgi:hypothetical protein